MLVFSGARAPSVLGHVTVVPGANVVPDKAFAEVSKRYGSALKRLRGMGEQGIETLPDDAPSLAVVSAKAAAAFAGVATFDQLMRWKSGEKRPPVVASLDARMNTIRKPQPLSDAARIAFDSGRPISEIRQLFEELESLRQEREKNLGTISDQARLLELQDKEIADLKTELVKGKAAVAPTDSEPAGADESKPDAKAKPKK